MIHDDRSTTNLVETGRNNCLNRCKIRISPIYVNTKRKESVKNKIRCFHDAKLHTIGLSVGDFDKRVI